MPRVFIGNFDFEHELAGMAAGISSSDRNPSELLRHSAGGTKGAELFWAWLPVAEVQDFIVAPGRIDPSEFAELTDLGPAPPRFIHETRELSGLQDVELVPWGWTKSVITFGKSRGWQCPAPPWDVVRQVNSRAFRFALEKDWNVGLPTAALVTSLAELEAVVQQHGAARRGWLLKANFGMSGREALRGRGTTIDENTRNWTQKRLASAGPIVFESIVERIAEAGIQIEIPRAGPPQLVGITPLLVDRSGVYRGSRFGCPARGLEPWQPAVGVGLRVAETVQRLGYFGPLGIDAMQYRDESGAIHLRPLQDLNARCTMGRLALGFRRLLPAGMCGSWLHFHRRHLAECERDDWLNNLRDILPEKVTTAATSPRHIGTRRVEHHAVLVLAPSSEVRRQAEAAILDSLGLAIDGH